MNEEAVHCTATGTKAAVDCESQSVSVYPAGRQDRLAVCCNECGSRAFLPVTWFAPAIFNQPIKDMPHVLGRLIVIKEFMNE